MKPDFVIVGAMRAGTSTLAAALAQDPRIFLPREEIHYFSDPDLYARGMEWYESHFSQPEAVGAQIVGEKSATYHYSPGAIERIARDLPNVRIIFILRDPLQRAYSHYWHAAIAGQEVRSFSASIREGLLPGQSPMHDYVDRSRYGAQLRNIYQRFAKERVHVCFLENLKNSPADSIEKFQKWMGLIPVNTELAGHKHRRLRSPRSLQAQKFIGKFCDRKALFMRGFTRFNQAIGSKIKPPSEEDVVCFNGLIQDDKECLEILLGGKAIPWV